MAHSSGVFYYSTPWLIKVNNRKKETGKDKERFAGEVGKERLRETVIEGKTERGVQKETCFQMTVARKQGT